MRTFSVCVPARRRVNVTFSYDVAENALRAFHLTFSGLLVFFTSDSDPCTCASPRFFFDRPSLSLSLYFSILARGVYTYRRSLEDKSKFVHEYLWERFVGTVVHKVLHLTVSCRYSSSFIRVSRRNFYDTRWILF